MTDFEVFYIMLMIFNIIVMVLIAFIQSKK